jgi:hypothetical protein
VSVIFRLGEYIAYGDKNERMKRWRWYLSGVLAVQNAFPNAWLIKNGLASVKDLGVKSTILITSRLILLHRNEPPDADPHV